MLLNKNIVPTNKKLCNKKCLVIFLGLTTIIMWWSIRWKADTSYLLPTDGDSINVEKQTVIQPQKDSKLNDIVKYVLIWPKQDIVPTSHYLERKTYFIDMGCPVTNCYFTKNRNFFKEGLQRFDAIAFNGNVLPKKVTELPSRRWGHQKYIYMNMESSVNVPVCSNMYDNFFNMTATYKLSSDVPYKYITIADSSGNTVGPHKDMKWINYTIDENETENNIFNNKKKAAAWFVSDCNAKSGRKRLANKLNDELAKYGYFVDVYGKCGTKSCPVKKNRLTADDKCDQMLENEYYFYLALENSFEEDYVTEKLLRALQRNVIPIVYGGADYSRFLPQHSYLDGRQHTPAELAKIMVELMADPIKYRQYFWWQKYYKYAYARTENICSICKRLNDNEFMQKDTGYREFRKWWNTNFMKDCSRH